MPYEVIEDKLEMTGDLLNCDRLCIACYRMLIENVFEYKPMKNVEWLYVGEFADKYPEGTYLVRMNGHITCVMDNTVYDIWDCRGQIVTDAWRVD